MVGTPVYFKFGKEFANVDQAYRKTFDDILDKDEEAYFIFNAIEENKDIDNDIIDTLIEHYEYSEEYEKCAELISIKKRGAKSSSSKS